MTITEYKVTFVDGTTGIVSADAVETAANHAGIRKLPAETNYAFALRAINLVCKGRAVAYDIPGLVVPAPAVAVPQIPFGTRLGLGMMVLAAVGWLILVTLK